MKLATINIRDFKRFHNLTIEGIPATAKLVIMTGPNGSGKTSVFEAFNYWMGWNRGQNHFDQEYHSRQGQAFTNDAQGVLNKIQLTFHGAGDVRQDATKKQKVFYIRSAYRHEPDFTTNSLGQADDMLVDSRRAPRLILPELRVSENYHRIVAASITALYDEDNPNRKAGEITDEIIGEVRAVMVDVFGDLVLSGPGNPLTGGTFRFGKGDSKNFHYKNLSGGEKAAFDLLLDFIVKRRAFDDTVFCIDEPELHMHTKLQAKLLEALFALVPDNCQLWIATHSIGMARKAAELRQTHADQVSFIDFHESDFDHDVRLSPISPSRVFWRNMFETALDDLAELVVPRVVILCEGKRLGAGGRKPSFDVEIYSKIFGEKYPDSDFIPLGGTNEVERDGQLMSALLRRLAKGIRIWSVFDRDDRHESEVRELQAKGIRVLARRDLESYLWDDEILDKLCRAYQLDAATANELAAKLKAEKASLLAKNPETGKPADDVKAVAGFLYNACKMQLGLTQCGNDAEAFARLTLAPLITPDTRVFSELEGIVFPQP
jgi:predicted ATPase